MCAAMKPALFLLLAAAADCTILGGNPLALLPILSPGSPDNPLNKIILPALGEINGVLSTFFKCLHTALTVNLPAAADALAKFVCVEAKHNTGQLDDEQFEIALEELGKALVNLGCVSPLSDVIGEILGNLKEIKPKLADLVSKNPLIGWAVLKICPIKVLFEGYRDLFSGNYTTC